MTWNTGASARARAAVSIAITRLSARVNAVYAADLIGAGAACLLLMPALNLLGAPGAIVAAALKLLDQHGLKLSDIQKVIGSLHPLEGGKEFLDELRSQVQAIILSDTFEQFASPFLQQLGWPTLLCHRLVVENDRVVNYQLRVPEQKQRAVAAFKLLNYQVIAAGDSFNDTAMLTEAHVGFLFRAPDNVKQQFPQFKAVEAYNDLMREIRAAMG
jgi:phosphoserine/homoserine phosphotransferase